MSFLRRMLAWREANAECRRAARLFAALSAGPLTEVSATLGEPELRHLRHTVFRINALLFLYAKLLRRPHETELGVLLGAITHLLDHAYDHRAGADVASFEEIVMLHRPPDRDQPLQTALATLAARAWRRIAAPALLAPRLHDMLDTQRRSLAQVGPTLDPTPLWELTSDKGFHSLCLYFAAVNERFGAEEAAALRAFGAYLQFMDDLEDLYEDRAEGRQSPVRGVLHGVRQGTVLFRAALRDITAFYRPGRYGVRAFVAWLVLFHLGIMVGALIRELTRRLPPGFQAGLERRQEWLSARVPFFYVAPAGYVPRRL
ncbi:hypothetical protein ABGB07_05635 [Micromonosporaceae bacterium B7E4]